MKKELVALKLISSYNWMSKKTKLLEDSLRLLCRFESSFRIAYRYPILRCNEGGNVQCEGCRVLAKWSRAGDLRRVHDRAKIGEVERGNASRAWRHDIESVAFEGPPFSIRRREGKRKRWRKRERLNSIANSAQLNRERCSFVGLLAWSLVRADPSTIVRNHSKPAVCLLNPTPQPDLSSSQYSKKKKK